MGINLDKLFSMADNDNLCNVKVVYDNGYKEYKVCDGSGNVILKGDLEEEIYLLFKYPEIYVKEISDYLDKDSALLSEYIDNPNLVRHKLRYKFKDLLYKKAEEIIEKHNKDKKDSVKVKTDEVVVKPKPIHKSKTVAVNTTLLISSILLIVKGIADKNYNEIEKGLVVLIPAIVNIILRFVTKCPIKI